MTQRRYDIDWLRVIAIGLLIIYHVSIAFQPWGGLIGFIQDRETIDWIWYPMSMLNMWRIPILFFVSGMGVYFSMQKRNLLKLLLERTQRIFVPFIFGILFIVPLHIFIWQKYYFQELDYRIEQSHLWFLQNIFSYTLMLTPLAYALIKTKIKIWMRHLRKLSVQPLVFVIAAALIICEAELIKPESYTMYAYSAHGWLIGFICFTLGIYLVYLGKDFWDCFKAWKWVYLLIACGLYFVRIFKNDFAGPYYLNALETTAWVFTVFGFFYQYANKPGSKLQYLSRAAYPVYIIHMVVQYGLSALIFPLKLPVNLNLLILSTLTLVVSLVIYHFLIRPVKWIRPLFGMKFTYN